KSIAGSIGQDSISSVALLYAMFAEPDSVAVRAIAMIADPEEVKNALAKSLLSGGFGLDEEGYGSGNGSFSQTSGNGKGHKLSENLLKFGSDLTEKASEGKLDPIIGRSKEIERIIQILSRRTKNNPVL